MKCCLSVCAVDEEGMALPHLVHMISWPATGDLEAFATQRKGKLHAFTQEMDEAEVYPLAIVQNARKKVRKSCPTF